MTVNSFRELRVWREALECSILIYSLTRQFPSEERFGLVSQMQRSAVSIPSNIAEGRYRGTKKDFTQFLHIAYGSGAELETQLEIAQRLGFGKREEYAMIFSKLESVMKMLNAMIQSLKKSL